MSASQFCNLFNSKQSTDFISESLIEYLHQNNSNVILSFFPLCGSLCN